LLFYPTRGQRLDVLETDFQILPWNNLQGEPAGLALLIVRQIRPFE
jgi:hypothetical protein